MFVAKLFYIAQLLRFHDEFKIESCLFDLNRAFLHILSVLFFKKTYLFLFYVWVFCLHVVPVHQMRAVPAKARRQCLALLNWS